MIPKFEDLRIAILNIISNGSVYKPVDLRVPLAAKFGLKHSDVSAEYPSGNGNIFSDRISWALSYLFISGLVDRPKRGVYKISQKGLEILQSKPEDEINAYIKCKVQEITELKKKDKSEIKSDQDEPLSEEGTPQGNLADSYEKIKRSVSADILQTILHKKPYEFERLVVKLLQSMGYGGEVKESGTVTKLTGDGGIDGIIKEDILGFNHISIQAKRYSQGNNVSRQEIQSFVGAVAVTSSKKGVFITTSDFTQGAVNYVGSLNGNPIIILINGRQLTDYIWDFGLGMQTESVLKVMKMDNDFWEAMEDDK